MLMNYKLTRSMINESSEITFYPRSGSTYQISNFLKTYIGLTPTQIQRILNLPSRWVTVHKSYPTYVFHEKGAYLVNSPDPVVIKRYKSAGRPKGVRKYV